jgi:mRNA interferase RelE/StbE
MRYTVEIDDKAAREIRALPRDLQRRVVSKIDSLADNPRPAGCVKLSGLHDLWRVRVGDWRVVYRVQDRVMIVEVLRVAHRREVYRGW